jgi:hypothetical protein
MGTTNHSTDATLGGARVSSIQLLVPLPTPPLQQHVRALRTPHTPVARQVVQSPLFAQGSGVHHNGSNGNTSGATAPPAREMSPSAPLTSKSDGMEDVVLLEAKTKKTLAEVVDEAKRQGNYIEILDSDSDDGTPDSISVGRSCRPPKPREAQPKAKAMPKPSKGSAPSGADTGNHATYGFVLSEATGSQAHKVNGRYLQSKETANARPIYYKEGSQDAICCWHAKRTRMPSGWRWMVSMTEKMRGRVPAAFACSMKESIKGQEFLYVGRSPFHFMISLRLNCEKEGRYLQET